MKLMSSMLSPYVRKVRMTAAIKGLESRIEHQSADTNAGDPALNKLNPLGKVPCLITDEGEAIFDSRGAERPPEPGRDIFDFFPRHRMRHRILVPLHVVPHLAQEVTRA